MVNALVFSGGGARGAYQIGVYEALHEEGFTPDIVTGTSVGAILATLVASGVTPDEMKSLWMEACRPGFLPYRKDIYRLHRWDHIRRNDKLETLLKDGIDWEAVHASSTNLRFTAVDVCTGERVLFDNAAATPNALMASTAIPLVFPQVHIDGETLWDGGLLTSTPLQPAIEAGATEIYAILNDPLGRIVHEPPQNLAQSLDRIIDIVNERALRQDLTRAEEINQLVEEGSAAEYWRTIHFHVIAPETPFSTNVLTFDKEESIRLWKQGYEDTRKFMQGLHQDQDALEAFTGDNPPEPARPD